MDSAELPASAEARQQRAIARSSRMTVQVLCLGEAGKEPADVSTALERFDRVRELTVAAWAVSGQPWLQLARAAWPVRVRQLGDPG